MVFLLKNSIAEAKIILKEFFEELFFAPSWREEAKKTVYRLMTSESKLGSVAWIGDWPEPDKKNKELGALYPGARVIFCVYGINNTERRKLVSNMMPEILDIIDVFDSFDNYLKAVD